MSMKQSIIKTLLFRYQTNNATNSRLVPSPLAKLIHSFPSPPSLRCLISRGLLKVVTNSCLLVLSIINKIIYLVNCGCCTQIEVYPISRVTLIQLEKLSEAAKLNCGLANLNTSKENNFSDLDFIKQMLLVFEISYKLR